MLYLPYQFSCQNSFVICKSLRQKNQSKYQNSDNHFDIKNLELLHMTQFSGKQNPLNTTITLPNQKYESTLISCLSQTNINLTNQINLVKEYNHRKQQRTSQKILLEKYATSDDSSLYLESSRFKIERNFNQIYKSGKFRWLYPGEEAAIIEVFKKISLLMMSMQKIQNLIINKKRLEYLFNYPICLKQIEAHWKILATIFKLKQQNRVYKNQATNKLWKDIQTSKTLFLDLNMDNNKLVLFVKQLQN
ncbi:unnamed protein product [Paramecium octaurelia]|uniref:Uncharacterized protein n=1 Tax=Paramecium octaurelia TaxID=43137 RepID=A0A8S1Y7Z2_PAROT|nr:unnamed protein product [Paramecium octaurelia]